MKPLTNLDKQKLAQVRQLQAAQMAKNLGQSMVKWAANGFANVTKETYDKRMAVCRRCEFWQENARLGYGKCLKCGCGKGKQWLPHEQCPIGKWGKET